MRRDWSSAIVLIALLSADAAAARVSQGVTSSSAPSPPRRPTPPGKLDPALDAIARGWRRLGVRGARRETEARNIPMKDLRIAAVVELTSVERRPEAERALRKSWVEIVSRQDRMLYVQLGVPSIRRIAALPAVASIRLDAQYHETIGPAKEIVR